MNHQFPATSAPSTTLYAVMRKVVTHLTILLELGPLIPPNEGSNSGSKGGKVHHLSARQAGKIIPNGGFDRWGVIAIIKLIKADEFTPHAHRDSLCEIRLRMACILERSTVTSHLSDVQSEGSLGGKNLLTEGTLWKTCNGMLFIINQLQ